MNILIADGHRLFLEGLKHLVYFSSPNAIIKEAVNGTEALSLITQENQFDLALVDQRLPGLNGFNLLKKLDQGFLMIPVLIISSSEDPEDAEKALRLGASGFVSKSFTPKELQNAIDLILSGVKGPYRQPFKEMGKVTPWAEQHKITPRQLEVLRLAKKGKDNSEIAQRLYITERTVKAHLAALFHSFEARSRTELVHHASQLGLD